MYWRARLRLYDRRHPQPDRTPAEIMEDVNRFHEWEWRR
jgi:hypothetical protein